MPESASARFARRINKIQQPGANNDISGKAHHANEKKIITQPLFHDLPPLRYRSATKFAEQLWSIFCLDVVHFPSFYFALTTVTFDQRLDH
jgi:hypothetical protein